MKLYSYADHMVASDSFRLFKKECQMNQGIMDQFQTEIAQLRSYIYSADSDWCLDQSILDLMDRVLNLQGSEGLRLKFVRLLCICAMRSNFFTLLMNDRSHVILKYCHQFDNLCPEEQRFVTILLLNISSNPKGIDYLMFFSPWEHQDMPLNNCQACQNIIRLALSNTNPNVRHQAWRLVANLSSRHGTYSERPQTLQVYNKFVEFVKSCINDNNFNTNENHLIIQEAKKNIEIEHKNEFDFSTLNMPEELK